MWLAERIRRWKEWLPSAALGVGAVLVFALLAWLVMMLIGAFLGLDRRAHAGEWLTDAQAYLYVERPWNDPGICYYSPSDMTSNLGADVTIWRGGYRYAGIEWHARATHHSCAFGRDGREYNAAGTGIVLRFRR